MIALLARAFIKNTDQKTPAQIRQAYGMLCGAAGVGLNILLFAGKVLAGVLSGSIAVTADAFNNLSDAASSVVMLLGFRLGGQKADRDHPFGHGRFEYLSGLVVAMLIVLMGFELAKTSLDKILHPQSVGAGGLTVVILLGSIAVKFYMFLYNRAYGKQFDSGAMLATATDSLSDCAATAVVLAATLVGQYTTLQIDGWCGILVALLIFWSGIKAGKETLDPLLGTPPAPEYVEQIRELVMAHDTVIGIHDLVVHDYGPGRCMISLHAEVSSAGDVLEIHDVIDNIEKELQEILGCEAVIHMDPVVTDDGITGETREKVVALVHCIDDAISIHDFRMVAGPTHTNVIFDAVVPFNFRLKDEEVRRKIETAVRTLDGNYHAVVNVEHSYAG